MVAVMVVDKVAVMVVNMEIDKVAGMVAVMVVDSEVDMVADMMADMEVDKVQWLAEFQLMYTLADFAHKLRHIYIYIFKIVLYFMLLVGITFIK